LSSEEEKTKKLETILKKYQKGKKDWHDGLLFEFPDFWFSVRPSNTEPLLRFVLEAKSREIMEAKVREISDILKK
jgi:phosphomannomutase